MDGSSTRHERPTVDHTRIKYRVVTPATSAPLASPAAADPRAMSDDRGNLVLKLRLGEPVRIGDADLVVFEAPRDHEGDYVRVRVTAPRDVRITRPDAHGR